MTPALRSAAHVATDGSASGREAGSGGSRGGGTELAAGGAMTCCGKGCVGSSSNIGESIPEKLSRAFSSVGCVGAMGNSSAVLSGIAAASESFAGLFCRGGVSCASVGAFLAEACARDRAWARFAASIFRAASASAFSAMRSMRSTFCSRSVFAGCTGTTRCAA